MKLKQRIKNILNFKKLPAVLIVAAAVSVIALSAGPAANRADRAAGIEAWETYDFPEKNYEGVFFNCNDSPHNPAFTAISAQLMNNQNLRGLSCGTHFTVVKQTGSLWKIVPFAGGVGFNDITYTLMNGSSTQYEIRPEMLAVEPGEGQYRIITEVYQKTGDGLPEKHIVWADFVIDGDAPEEETFERRIPSEAPVKIYTLENPTDKQRFERLLSVKLYSDGTAWLETPAISSYMPPNCVYAFVDDEMLIYADIETENQEGFFGVKNGGIIAKFTVADEKTLVFQSANVPIFADEGARYLDTPPEQ